MWLTALKVVEEAKAQKYISQVTTWWLENENNGGYGRGRGFSKEETAEENLFDGDIRV